MALQTLAPEYESVNPFDGKTLETFATITDEQLEKKIATAQACYQIWRTKSYAERAAVVSKAADLMRANVDAFARTMTLEMGKRIDEARGEVTFSADILTYYAKNAERFLAPVKLNPKIGSAHMESSPIGIVFAVEPWNFPYYQLARVAGPHQMAGNVLMVKHAGIVPRCALAFEKLCPDRPVCSSAYASTASGLRTRSTSRPRALTSRRARSKCWRCCSTATISIRSRISSRLRRRRCKTTSRACWRRPRAGIEAR